MSNPNIAKDSSTTFKKGKSGNPKGRPKEPWTMTGLYIEAGEEAHINGEPKKKIVARKLWDKAMKGDVVAIKELNNRIDGMPKQKIDLDGTILTGPIPMVPERDKPIDDK